MKLSRRDALILLTGGAAGGALAVAAGLTYRHYSRVKWRPVISRPASRMVEAEWVLTEEDLDAFARSDALVQNDELTILDNTDILGGGDFSAMRVSGLEECVAACEEDRRCQAFTYARSTHRLPEKRQICWLKEKEPDRIISDLITYVSGHR